MQDPRKWLTGSWLSFFPRVGTLRNNIAAVVRAKVTYERLIECTDDPGTIVALMFLMTREVTHMKAFMAAMASLGLDPLEIGKLRPNLEYVNLYFNDSTGSGEWGEDARGPWNSGGDWEYVENSAFDEARTFLGNGERSNRARGK
jgi:Mn-containing catalase